MEDLTEKQLESVVQRPRAVAEDLTEKQMEG
jgi:hypothetical protein